MLRWLVVALVFAGLAPAQITLAENDGFCSGGGYRRANFATWGSYCAQGDASVGRAATNTFQLSGPFEIYLAGYPFTDGLTLRLENVSDHQTLDIRPDTMPGETWKQFQFDLPDSWRGKELRIVAEDRSTGVGGWLAFSNPSGAGSRESYIDAKRVLLKTLTFTLLLFLPGFTLGAFAISRRVYGQTKLGLIILAGIAMPGYFMFWVYVFSAAVGYWLSARLPYLFGALLMVLLFRLTPHDRRRLLPSLIPLALTLFAALGIIALGYTHGRLDDANGTAWTRFSHPLPPDNELPFLFAEGLRKGVVPRPLLADWLSSDRPPLQTGMILELESFMRSRSALAYNLASVVIQSLWIFAVWLLLRAFRITRLTAGTVMTGIYFSGFTIVNSFFVWPKLLAAAYFVAFAIPVLVSRQIVGRPSWMLRCLMGFLLACSLLAHGGSAFAVAGVLLFVVIRRRKALLAYARGSVGYVRGWLGSGTCIVAVITILFYSPWIGYQIFIDPPGDRLLKYHLAGVEPVTNEPTLKVIYEAYRKQTFAQFLEAKRANVMTLFGHEGEFLAQLPHLMNRDAEARIRVLVFFYFLPSLGFLGFGVAGLVLPSGRKSAATRLLLCSACMMIPFTLLMFRAASTVLHVSTYAWVLMSMAGSILAFRAVAPRLAVAVCAFQCIFTWIVYAPDLASPAPPFSLTLRASPWMIGLHVVSICGFFAMLALNRPLPSGPLTIPPGKRE